MYKPTLLFVEETKNTLSSKVIERKDINLVLLRFKHNMLFDKVYLDKTANIPCFILDKNITIDIEVERFRNFCLTNNLKIDYFYNDSEYNQEKVQEFASLLNLKGALTAKQARWVRDKAAMKDKIKEMGYRAMDYMELTSNEDAYKFAERCGGFPIIVKWRRGLSSKEVYKIENKKQLDNLNLDYSTRRFIVEAYCPYLIWCVDALVQDGNVIATFLTWLPYTNLSFAEKKEKFAQITVAKRPDEIKFDETTVAQDIVSGVGLENGYLHLEVFVEPSGEPIICEFAWRTPGEHMLLNHSIAFDIDVYNLLIDIMVGRKVELLELVGKRCVGDMFLPLTEGEISRISSYDDLKDLDGVIDGKINYKVGDIVQSKRQYTDCSGWMQVEGKTKDEVVARMLKIYEKFELVTNKLS